MRYLSFVFLAAAAYGQGALGVPAVTSSVNTPADYQLGPGDQFSVTVPDLETDFNGRTFRIDASGDVTVPVAGRVHAAGLSTVGLEDELVRKLVRVLKNPDVTVTLATFGSKPVSILGSVNAPGIRQIEMGKSLFEVLSIAGGLRPDAGYLIHVTRDMHWGPIPLANARPDETGKLSTASVRVKSLMDGASTGENIPILPGDIISVPRAQVVYAVGDINRPGGFQLDEHETLSVLQVVSLAGGVVKTAAKDKAKIIRIVEGSPDRTEIPVDLKALMAGKGTDVPLRSGDILFVPNSAAKSAAYRSIDSIISIASGLAVYGKL